MVSVGRMVPGESDELLERQHVARYQFASSFARCCSVLDVACGMGYAAPLFIKAGARSYLGVDLDQRTVNRAIERYGVDDKIKFLVEDACELCTIPEASFDLVVSFETVEHLARPETFLANVRRVLRPEGTLLISTPNRLRYSPGHKLSSKPWNPYHVKEWTVREFVDLLHLSFRTTEVLGQVQIPCWKALVLYYTANFKWLNRLFSALHSTKEKANSRPQNGSAFPLDAHAVKAITPWFTPLYAVCVAKPRL